jgi:hypothetical protein
MTFKPHVRALGLALGLTASAFTSSAYATTSTSPTSFTYEFKTYFDESTWLSLTDTNTFSASVATLTIADITGGVQITLKANSTSFPAKTTAGTFIEDLWLDGPNGTLKLTSTNTSLNAGGYSILPAIPELGYSYNWDIDFKSATFAEGETATLTLLGSGINARALASAGLPMISLGNVGSPWGASLSGTTHFLADCAQPIPEPSTYAMAALGLAGLGVWSRRKKA